MFPNDDDLGKSETLPLVVEGIATYLQSPEEVESCFDIKLSSFALECIHRGRLVVIKI
jgi:hypothetical protein